MENDPTAAVYRLARALSDPTRLRIAAMLVEQTCTIDELARALGLRPSEVSRHLTVLREHALVVEEADETSRYQLDVDELRRVSRVAFATQRAESAIADGNAWEQKVLRDFVKNDRLTSIPASHKKRQVILRWLAKQVPADTPIPEREIRTILEQFHSDFATLRRELVDNGFLTRERGIYWRSTRSTPPTS